MSIDSPWLTPAAYTGVMQRLHALRCPFFIVGFMRPYKPEYCDKLIAFMKQGNPYRSFAAELGIALSDLDEWADKHAEFAYAIKVGDAKRYAHWYQEMQDGDKTAIDVLEREYGWRPRRLDDLATEDKVDFIIETIDRGEVDPTDASEANKNCG